MKHILERIIGWFNKSVDNKPEGPSSKKLTGFWLVVICSTPPLFVWVFWAYTHDDWALFPIVVPMYLTSGLIALGINSSEKKKGVAYTPPPGEVNSEEKKE